MWGYTFSSMVCFSNDKSNHQDTFTPSSQHTIQHKSHKIKSPCRLSLSLDSTQVTTLINHHHARVGPFLKRGDLRNLLRRQRSAQPRQLQRVPLLEAR